MKQFHILLVFSLLLVGCQVNLPPQAEIAEQHLVHAGYKVVSYEGSYKYVLKNESLTQMPYMMDWGVQRTDPTPFIGSTVEIEKFMVTNHPLDHWTSGSMCSQGKTAVSVWIVDKQVIGGTSFPVPSSKELLVGGNYALDGKTLEEVQSTDYLTWLEQWQLKFEMQNLIGKPPFPTAAVGDKPVKIVRGSSCWRNEDAGSCVEKASPREILKHVVPTPAASGSELAIAFPREPVELSVKLWTDLEVTDVHRDGNSITLPMDHGLYYYVVSARWEEGNSDFVFGVEVEGAS